MIVLSVANQKGGVGKTTSVVSLGGLLSLQGYKTLLLDLDPHGSMTSYFRLNPDLIETGVYQLFVNHQQNKNRNTRDYICATKFKDLSLIPASTALATLDRQLGSIDGMGLVVSRSLVSIFDDYQFAIIDCPPQLGVLMVNALAACKTLIIPVQTEFLALKGLERMMRTLTMIAKAKQFQPDFSILPTMYDQRTRASRETLNTLRQNYSNEVWHGVIPIDTQFREASRLGIPLPILSQSDRGSIAYNEFLHDMILEDSTFSKSVNQS